MVVRCGAVRSCMFAYLHLHPAVCVCVCPHKCAPVTFAGPCCLPGWLQVNGTHLYIVVNAGCREKDLAHINKHLAEAKVGEGRIEEDGGGQGLGIA